MPLEYTSFSRLTCHDTGKESKLQISTDNWLEWLEGYHLWFGKGCLSAGYSIAFNGGYGDSNQRKCICSSGRMYKTETRALPLPSSSLHNGPKLGSSLLDLLFYLSLMNSFSNKRVLDAAITAMLILKLWCKRTWLVVLRKSQFIFRLNRKTHLLLKRITCWTLMMPLFFFTWRVVSAVLVNPVHHILFWNNLFVSCVVCCGRALLTLRGSSRR